MDNGFIRDVKKFIKQETSAPVQRLQSLRLPPDLRLGGTKLKRGLSAGTVPTKKQFVPNLGTARNKDKSNEFLKKFEQKNHKEKREKSQNRKRDNAPRLVQSSGIFSEGVASDIRKSNRWNDVRDKENDATASMPVPTIKKRSWKVDKQEEDKILDEIMEDDEDVPDEKLPFEPFTWHSDSCKGITIKKEMENLKLEHYQPMNFQLDEYMNHGFYNDDNPSISLWELPDSLAAKGLSDDPNCKKVFDYNLNDMVEGQIGKLVRRKSGKIEMHIGNIKYNLEPVITEKYTEHILTLDSHEKNDSGKATVLGQIQNRYKINPLWDSLLK